MPWVNPSTHTTGYKVTSANWNQFATNFQFLAELGYAEFTSPVAVTATTVATATQIVTLGAITYENVPVLIEFFTPKFATNVPRAFAVLRDGTTVLGTIIDQNATIGVSAYVAHRRTPTAGSHSYNIAVWNNAAGTTNVNGGTGGAAGDSTTYLPGWIRATAIPT
jgi:hypothetical protein